ncbi:MAG: hypothetical protein MJ156_02030 [Alphaproteobacteria bacterium]|nr:hypothetical protein [Alphaproteobacteria bacterium]
MLFKYNFVHVLLVSMFLLTPFMANAKEYKDTVYVTHTAETSADAKNIAIDDARRQILYNILSQYSNPEELNILLQNTTDMELTNFISFSSIANEQSSKTVYSANVTMSIDNAVVKKWLQDHEINNWLPVVDSIATFTTVMNINGVSDWVEIKQLTKKYDLSTKNIVSNQIVTEIPSVYRSQFTASVREAGWHYSDNNGVLHIWK